ncbi:AAA family ATPase [Desulfuromonas sp. TF]|uniref:AAA family ATPase n=1 Tax=Desulfuromonas sp. TF TaxID=1232410 RepID=UPI00041A8955|nr:AAA family ATPase [Desulfuromonas sp. TF]
MPEDLRLDLQKSYAAILEAARKQQFLSYGDLAAANNMPWSQARRRMPQHLGQLVTIAHERGWPMPSAIVVSRESVPTGLLEGGALEGFLAAARDVGHDIKDPQAFVREQQEKVFKWADAAPEKLDLQGTTSEEKQKKAGPRFVTYFAPVLDALRELGGEAKPADVLDWISSHIEVPQAEIEGVNKSGQTKFENKVAWARFYLSKAGLIDPSKYGIWKLTEAGRETSLDHAQALAIYKDIHSSYKDSDEDEPAPESVNAATELLKDTSRQFWFAGAVWGEEDQLNRFRREGVWQNGYDDKFSNLVERMKAGDRIAIKASFVQKHNLPFSVGGKAVSCMRIKATGTITENMGDGSTVRVHWDPPSSPKDWYFYTYRTTLVEADPDDDLARRLVLFTFADAPQDYDFWLKVPYFAKRYSGAYEETGAANDDLIVAEEVSTSVTAAPTYSIDTIIAEGCFLPKLALEAVLSRLSEKKNLILQGPPGTGKTWLAKRLGYALLGSKDRKIIRSRLRTVQFHPSLSYEDFIRGWRPQNGGGLKLVDGVFLEAVQASASEPDLPFVFIIEEINRGNPAQVFGEMLTLLEDGKRKSEEALELAYPRGMDERIHIPPNLHVIGTMNIADRSLALVDLALRRRFAFITLEPQLGESWSQWCQTQGGLDLDAISLIQERMTELNKEIENDRTLGPQFRVGHSFVTPLRNISKPRTWFRQVVETEIAPLLEEYWFDAIQKAVEAKGRLLSGLE